MIFAIANWDWALDGWIIVAGVLCACGAALLGNFLVLRKMSLLGDAISHAILPGLAIAFLITESRTSWAMFVGAAIVGVLTAVFTESIHRLGNVDEGAAMGVVFTTLFAIGVLLIVQAVDHVDLDPGCVLYGAIEMTPEDPIIIWGREMPRVVAVLGVVLAVNALFVVACYKELKITSFDPELATTLGVNARWMHYGLMTLVAITAVASFEAVGNILVVAMFVVPAATAQMLTNRLPWMILISLVVAALGAIVGHVGAIVVPAAFGYGSTTSAGMMAVAVGLFFGLALLFSPSRGLAPRLVRRLRLTGQIIAEDLLGLLYRNEEFDPQQTMTFAELSHAIPANRLAQRCVLLWLVAANAVARDGKEYRLSEAGRDRAAALLRAHRLWEEYLVKEGDVLPDKTHPSAERLEHFTDKQLRRRLDKETAAAAIDPHGKPIPPERP
ncbi:MAG: metal ABC transporter permease [Pirellulales bacterium]